MDCLNFWSHKTPISQDSGPTKDTPGSEVRSTERKSVRLRACRRELSRVYESIRNSKYGDPHRVPDY